MYTVERVTPIASTYVGLSFSLLTTSGCLDRDEYDDRKIRDPNTNM